MSWSIIRSIHSISIDPLIVHYWSTHQLVIYKDLCESYIKISIDATGGLVKKINRSSLNLTSSHIFLYEAVINCGYGQTSITQMISEKQNCWTIYKWLGNWLNRGIKPPNEAVSDFSMVLYYMYVWVSHTWLKSLTGIKINILNIFMLEDYDFY